MQRKTTRGRNRKRQRPSSATESLVTAAKRNSKLTPGLRPPIVRCTRCAN